MPSKVLLDAALKEKVNLTAISLGMLIQDIWDGKVKKQKKDHGSGFLNLRRRSINGIHLNDVPHVGQNCLKISHSCGLIFSAVQIQLFITSC